VGRLLAAAALRRRESRGAHYRSDFPAADAAAAQRTLVTAADLGVAPAAVLPAAKAAGARA
jgi:L-aspartate oxidase